MPLRPAARALAAPTCRVRYWTYASCNGGFLTQIAVRNAGAQPIKGWKLRWAFADEERLKYAWNVRASQTRSVVTARNVDWNRVIPPGRSHTFGFIGEQHDDEHDPSLLFFLNDAWCAAD